MDDKPRRVGTTNGYGLVNCMAKRRGIGGWNRSARRLAVAAVAISLVAPTLWDDGGRVAAQEPDCGERAVMLVTVLDESGTIPFGSRMAAAMPSV